MKTRIDTIVNNQTGATQQEPTAVTGTDITQEDGTKKRALDVNIVDTNEDNKTLEENVAEIRLLLRHYLYTQEKHTEELLIHLRKITDEWEI